MFPSKINLRISHFFSSILSLNHVSGLVKLERSDIDIDYPRGSTPSDWCCPTRIFWPDSFMIDSFAIPDARPKSMNLEFRESRFIVFCSLSNHITEIWPKFKKTNCSAPRETAFLESFHFQEFFLFVSQGILLLLCWEWQNLELSYQRGRRRNGRKIHFFLPLESVNLSVLFDRIL